jgi:chromosome segregation ATPase
MNVRNGLGTAFFALAIALPGCGGSAEKGAESPSNAAANEPTGIAKLEAMGTDIKVEANQLTKPLDELDAAMAEVSSLPERTHIDQAAIIDLATKVASTGKVTLTAELKISQEQKAMIEASLKRLANAVVGVKAIPNRVPTTLKNVSTAMAQLPAVATQVSSQLTVKSSNPFAAKAEIDAAKADLARLQAVQNQVMAEITGVQAKVTELPARATAALEKMAASFSARGAGGTTFAASVPTTSAGSK